MVELNGLLNEIGLINWVHIFDLNPMCNAHLDPQKCALMNRFGLGWHILMVVNRYPMYQTILFHC